MTLNSFVFTNKVKSVERNFIFEFSLSFELKFIGIPIFIESLEMPFSNDRRGGATNYPSIGPDDCLSDELPDYSSRRSSFYVDQKPNPFELESDRHRKTSTASNMLEVPRYSLYERHNSSCSTASLVSNTSGGTFSYRNLAKPKIKNAFGSLVVLIGLCLLVLGILFLIFGHRSGSIQIDNSRNNDKTSDSTINYSNISSTYERTNNTKNNGSNNTTETTTQNNNNTETVITNVYAVSPIETIGYFALFSGILLILIGISIICLSMNEMKPKPQNPNKHFKRRVSTIEIEPQNIPNEVPVTKPEIMITTDNLKEKVTYTKYPMPQPILSPRPSISTDLDDQFRPRSITNEYQKRFPF